MAKKICITLEWKISDVMGLYSSLLTFKQTQEVLDLMEYRTDAYIAAGWAIMAECVNEVIHQATI